MILEIDNLTGGYKKKNIVHNISFALDEGEILSILGPNGCGKTTLLKLILHFLPNTNGKIIINNENIAKISAKDLANLISYIPQKDSITFPYTVLEIVTMGRTNQLKPFSIPSPGDFEFAYNSLSKLKISNLADKKYTRISGGEKQLVLIARALCQNAKILIMDEPTAGLDFSNQQHIMEVIEHLAQNKKTILFTTHHPQEPFLISTKVLLMSHGSVVKFGNANEVLTTELLEKVYKVPIEIIKIKDKSNKERKICLIN